LTTTFRTPKGTLLTARGDNPDQFKAALMVYATDGDVQELVAEIENKLYVKDALGATPVQAPPANQWAPTTGPAQPAQQQPDGGSCQHGGRIWKSGNRKSDNKPWAGWFCPQNKNDCAPKWPDK
jgi:hypothetical protein